MTPAAPPLPAKPRKPLPADACDCHAHVFGPFDRFPLAENRSYTPPLAPVAAYWEMLDHVGFSRAVVVQASAYGVDNRCTADAVAGSAGRMRGIGVVDTSITDAELAHLGSQGIRGMRFTEITSRAGTPMKGAVGFQELLQLGPRLREQGMHAQIFASCDEFVAAAPKLLALDVPLVLDHMGRFGPGSRSIDDAAFKSLLSLLSEGRIWVKLTLFRNAVSFDDFSPLRPFHDALLRANPHQLVWGSDWPLLNSGRQMPDIGRMLDLLEEWTGEALSRRILVNNPAALYGFDAPGS
jgi:2-pyrone-4,6-dicarboxylate lactonase